MTMNDKNREIGYFVFSLDTELAWGSLWNQPHPKRTSQDGSRERETILRLLDIMDEFGVVATWAITGHLFFKSCEKCAICSIMELKGKDSRFEIIRGSQSSMWYGADIVELLHSRDSGHEICFHGYSHRLFDTMTDVEARFEIQEWIKLAKRTGIVPLSVIFPQGRLGHLDLFAIGAGHLDLALAAA